MMALLQWPVGRKALHRNAVALLVLLCTFCGSAAGGAPSEAVVVTIAPHTVCPGDVAKISITPATQVASATGLWSSQSLLFYHDVSHDALIAFLGVDLTEPAGSRHVPITFTDKSGHPSTNTLTLQITAKIFPVQELSLPKVQVNLSPQDLQRHEREQALIADVFVRGRPERLWKKAFAMPIDSSVVSPFGVRRIINNQPRSPHSGIDLKAAAGTPVKATSDGVVAYIGNFFFSGNSVFLDHGMGIFSMYFHLLNATVLPGQQVSAGQIIGLAGSTGRSTGPHLHWGIRLHNQRVDPLSFLKTVAD